MNTADFAKGQLEQAFQLLNTAADGMDDAQYNWKPGGTCNPIAKTHVHAATSADFFITMMLAGGQISWPAVATANNLPANPMEIWNHASDIPLSVIKDYSQNVQKSVVDYVSKMSDADMERIVETRFFGKQPAAYLVQLAAVHLAGHAGDMSSVKGMQGLKGLPF